MADWTAKYRPGSLDDIRGHDNELSDLNEWADTWDDHREAVILYGPPGVGKTTAAHALANDRGWDTVELNASDKRTRGGIEQVAGSASGNQSLSNSRTLIIVDEADNIHGNYDRGGSRAITDIVKDSGQPIVLIANNFYDLSRGLRNACRDIEFGYLDKQAIGRTLRDILDAEDIEYDLDSLMAVAEQADGDVRGAVNDLQAVASGRESIVGEDLATGGRQQEEDIFPYLDGLFKEYTAKEAIDVSREVDETPDRLLQWIDDNIAKVYTGEELATAYEFLANADVWLGRVRATQDYSYWRYAAGNMAGGVAAAREGSHGGWTRYQPPQYRSPDSTKMEVAQRIAEKAGVSTGVAFNEILPFLSAMTHHCKNRDLTVRMAAYYEFDEEDVSLVTGSGVDTNKVADVVSDAEDLRGEWFDEHASAMPPAMGVEGTDDESGETEDAVESDDDGDDEGDEEDKGSVEDDDDGDGDDEEDEEGDGDDDDGQQSLTDFM